MSRSTYEEKRQRYVPLYAHISYGYSNGTEVRVTERRVYAHRRGDRRGSGGHP